MNQAQWNGNELYKGTEIGLNLEQGKSGMHSNQPQMHRFNLIAILTDAKDLHGERGNFQLSGAHSNYILNSSLKVWNC